MCKKERTRKQGLGSKQPRYRQEPLRSGGRHVPPNACFSGASIEDANLEGMRINGVLVSDLFEAYKRQAMS